MQQIGPYTTLKKLGSGGFGEVWLAENPLRQVAIKVFKPKADNLDSFVSGSNTSSEGLEVLKQRFVNEAQILASLDANPHIVSVYELGTLEDGSPYYVMPYLSHSLAELLGKDVYDAAAMAELPEKDRPRALPLPDALSYLQQCLEGLAAAHERGLIHRDIKPSNIMFSSENELRIVDFGIAKAPDSQHSVSQLGMGSQKYMAPEQRESAKHVDTRADIYSLGVMAYRMITGRLPGMPFQDPNVLAPNLGQPINDLIVRCLADDKEMRPRDAIDMLNLLRDGLRSSPDSDDTGTWVGGAGTSDLRSELKPIRDEILNSLREHTRIDDDTLKRLRAMASIVDLDDQGLEELIDNCRGELGPELGRKQKFLEMLHDMWDDHIIDESERQTLYRAAELTGWTEADVDRLIEAHKPEDSSREPEQTQTEHASPSTPGEAAESPEEHTAESPPLDAYTRVSLTLEEVVLGVVKEIPVASLVCATCAGVSPDCPDCLARGYSSLENAEGVFRVSIPRGVEIGDRISVERLGFEADGREGDLHVEIADIAADEKFLREGNNLSMELAVTPALAETGGKVSFDLFGTDIELSVPEGTEDQTLLRLRNQGIYSAAKKTQGHLFVRIVIDPDLENDPGAELSAAWKKYKTWRRLTFDGITSGLVANCVYFYFWYEGGNEGNALLGFMAVTLVGALIILLPAYVLAGMIAKSITGSRDGKENASVLNWIFGLSLGLWCFTIPDLQDRWSDGDEAAVQSDQFSVNTESIRQVQKELNRLGYPAGPEDGKLGAKTTNAISQFQRDHGLTATGEVTFKLLQELRSTVSSSKRQKQPPVTQSTSKNGSVKVPLAQDPEFIRLTRELETLLSAQDFSASGTVSKRRFMGFTGLLGLKEKYVTEQWQASFSVDQTATISDDGCTITLSETRDYAPTQFNVEQRAPADLKSHSPDTYEAQGWITATPGKTGQVARVSNLASGSITAISLDMNFGVAYFDKGGMISVPYFAIGYLLFNNKEDIDKARTLAESLKEITGCW